jgi:hypothetical protein
VEVVEPPGKVAIGGTVLVKVSATEVSLATVPLKVTVPVEGFPPWTVLGETLTSESWALTVTVRTAVTVTLGVPDIVAEITTLRSVAGLGVVVLIVNVRLKDPAWTVTVEPSGNVTLGSELARVTDPPVVLSFNVTVPVTVPPPFTLMGSTARETGNRLTPVRAVETRSPRPS